MNKANDRCVHDLTFYKFVIDSLPAGVFTVDSELKIIGFNAWAEEITGYKEKDVLGSHCGEILKGELCMANCPINTVLNRQNPVITKETIIHNRKGEKMPVRICAACLHDDAGKLIGGVETFQDISYLKTLEREKNNLISMFAHDMKSPLVSIQGFALRLTYNMDKEKNKQYLEIIKKEAGKIEFLVNDFLEFSRLQYGSLKLNFSATSLDKELLELFSAYQPKVLQTGVKLKLQNTQQMPIIPADTNRLRRVFTNLLDNAFKFSREGGTITIKTEETEKDVIVSVIDDGCGIDPDDLPYIFDAFHRGKGVEEKEGHGVGLAAVKAIVKGHGGRILVNSEIGKGSVFTVLLPKERRSE